MGTGTTFLAGLRVLAVLVVAAGIGLGAWALTIVHDIDSRGISTLKSLLLQTDEEILWRQYFDTAMGSQTRIWIAIAAASFSFLASSSIVFLTKIERLKPSHYILIPLEFTSMFAMATAFGATLSLTIQLDSACIRLAPSFSPKLRGFETLCPLSKGYTIGNGAGGFLLTVTALVALISTCAHQRTPESCSFEPTASALGMGHGYQTAVPTLQRATIPSVYDPLKPTPGTPKRPLREDEGGLLEKGAMMGVRQPIEGEQRRSMQAEISGPLALEKPAQVRNIRAMRPWSEMQR